MSIPLWLFQILFEFFLNITCLSAAATFGSLIKMDQTVYNIPLITFINKSTRANNCVLTDNRQ